MKKFFTCLLFLISLNTYADYLIVSRDSYIYEKRSSSSRQIERVSKGTLIQLIESIDCYYKVIAPVSGEQGWIYCNRVRRRTGDIPMNNSLLIPPNSERLRSDFLPPLASGNVIIRQRGYVSDMSVEFNIPKWVFHHINKNLLDDSERRTRPSGYKSDPSFATLKTTAYAGSGYDHGHLAPAGDFQWDGDIFSDSFFMTNMGPQHGCMNQKGWCLLESNVREWARNRPQSDFYIFSGSVLRDFIDTLCLLNDVQIFVPPQFFKVVLEVSNNSLVGGIAFLVDNSDVNGTDIASLAVTIDQVEILTGLNFFPILTQFQEQIAESRIGNYAIENF